MESIIQSINEIIQNMQPLKAGLIAVYSSLIVIALVSLIFSRIGK